ncbi:MAG: chromosomal replication initiator protein DnaA [Nitrospirae bacterium]|nr:chromosomal replication initiator protein DnaA [Nitrospirota bacterium]MBI3351974.1 chromosomal replication initiator protein DnaA [Nitrospirota bacterium]
MMDMNEIWKENLSLIETQINKQSFDMWFKPLRFSSFEKDAFIISAPNKLFGEWIFTHYQDQIDQNLETLTQRKDIKVVFVIDEAGLTKEENAAVPERRADKEKRKVGLNAKHVFSSFVVGSSNQFAHAASLKVAEEPGKTYNPLFLYGGAGLGKTHLLNAIGNAMYAKNNGLNIVYLPSEKFTNELINSIRYDKMPEFRGKYRHIDVLLIDDIQFIQGKERTQEEFFHTFNTLYEDNKQIVLSSDRSTKEMSDIEERLRSRFEMGLIADIQPPDLETRIAILKKKADAEKTNLPDDLALFLATHIKNNIRVLEGSLNRVGAFSSLTGETLSIDLARRVLQDIIVEKKKMITPEDIQKIVSEKLHIKINEMKSKKRTKNLVFPRQLAMYLCRELTELSFPEIGKHFGGKDHSTVIHACRQVEKLNQADGEGKALIDRLRRQVKDL